MQTINKAYIVNNKMVLVRTNPKFIKPLDLLISNIENGMALHHAWKKSCFLAMDIQTKNTGGLISHNDKEFLWKKSPESFILNTSIFNHFKTQLLDSFKKSNHIV
jgi:hypothetical protein